MAYFARVEHALSDRTYDEKVVIGSPDAYLKSIGIKDREFSYPTVCTLKKPGGHVMFLARDEWGDVLADDDQCLFVTYPREFATVGYIVVAVIAIASAVYARQAAKSTNQASIAKKQELDQAKPTYELSQQKNTNRLGQPVAVQYGRIRSYLDLGSKSYTRYESNDQFLYTLMVLGEGSFDFEELRIDDTPIGNYEGATVNVLPPATPPSLVDIVETSIDIASIELGNAFNGPFTATAVGFTANKLEFDIEFPLGLYNNGSSDSVQVYIEIRQIDDDGAPIGSYIEVFNFLTTDTTLQPINLTKTHVLAAEDEGRYEARVRRDGETDTGTNIFDKATWTGMRAFSADGHPDYGDRTLVEVKIKATDQLNNNNIGIFNAVSTRKINVWNGASFDFIASTSVVWAFYDLATNTNYGSGLDPATRLDIDDLYAFSQQFDALGYETNIRIENSLSAMEAFKQLVEPAQAQVYQRGGKLWIARDEPKEAITAFFTPANIVPGSLTVTWNLPSVLSSDYVNVTYLDDVTWQQEVVAGIMPDTTATVARDVRVLGVTDRQRAWELAQYFAAQDRYRNKAIEFTTDIEGYLPNYLDHISISHDSLVDYQNGTIQEYDDPDFYLDNPADFKGEEFGYISLKAFNGEMIGPFSCVPGDTAYKVRVPLFDEVTFPIVKQIDGPSSEPTRYSFAPGSLGEASQIAVVQEVVPNNNNSITIRCINNDNRVYTSSIGVAPPIGRQFAD